MQKKDGSNLEQVVPKSATSDIHSLPAQGQEKNFGVLEKLASFLLLFGKAVFWVLPLFFGRQLGGGQAVYILRWPIL